ncbi:hypothetical protein [Diplocloster modestus]|uniref:DUF3784 domain-containing protein n=1 Tax=Diplocloster modestus TaxID=2850322 RepID=A0ABS6KDX5_9FIRM|nr:hypothetical protein [Diplocloster modestus]MBU9728718.1 hypothetical protein [Diplocloster modestus]
MDSMFVLLDVIVFGCGIYCLYAWYLMKVKGEVKTGFLVSKDVDMKKCKDLPGYLAYMGPRTLIFALFTTVYGGICLINDFVLQIGSAIFIGMIVFFAALVWFALCTRKAMKTFW